MTVGDYIKQKFQSFGIQMLEADLLDMYLTSGINMEGEMNLDCYRSVCVAITKFIPSLLLHPASIGESGFSISRTQRADIEAYYQLLCKQHGLKDQLSNKPTCTFL